MNEMSNLCNVEACEIFIENIPLYKEVEKIPTSHVFENLTGQKKIYEDEMKSDIISHFERGNHKRTVQLTRYRWSQSWKL